MTSRQLGLMTRIRACIAEASEITYVGSPLHLDLREFANSLEWYLENRVEEKDGREEKA